jgi:hypothetical protein
MLSNYFHFEYHIGGVKVNMLASIVEDRGFERRSGQT